MVYALNKIGNFCLFYEVTHVYEVNAIID